MSFYADSNNNTSSTNGGGFFSPGGTHTADGGYAGTPDAFGSQQKSRPKSKYHDKMVPVTISQILKAENDMNDDSLFRYNSAQEFSQVKFVGFVTGVKDTSTHVEFTIADGTGEIAVQFWADSSDDDDAGSSIASNARTLCTEGSYVRTVGMIKFFSNRKTIQAFNMVPVTDFNEITHHALEATYVYLKVTKGTGASNSVSNDVSTKTYEGTSSSGGVTDEKALQTVVLQVFQEHSDQGESGLDIKRAVEMLVSKGHDAGEVRKAIGFLSDEGHLYTTIDEDHLKCT